MPEIMWCIDCEKELASDEFNERCEACKAKYYANRERDDYEGDGVFADNH